MHCEKQCDSMVGEMRAEAGDCVVGFLLFSFFYSAFPGFNSTNLCCVEVVDCIIWRMCAAPGIEDNQVKYIHGKVLTHFTRVEGDWG